MCCLLALELALALGLAPALVWLVAGVTGVVVAGVAGVVVAGVHRLRWLPISCGSTSRLKRLLHFEAIAHHRSAAVCVGLGVLI
jgi:hypothetical protein